MLAGREQPMSPSRALAAGLALTLVFAGVEVVSGLLSGSLALISDAVHMLVDSAGLMLALAAALIARRPASLERSFGYARGEVLVVPLHVLLMLALAGYVAFEAVRRLGDPVAIDAWPVLVVGAIGLAINLGVMRLLHNHSAANLNIRGALLEVAVDAIGSAGVILSAIVLLTTGWERVDVIVSLAIAALVVPRALALLRHSFLILLEATPPGVRLEAIQEDARAVEGVHALHDLHVWALAPSFVALSAHVEVEEMDRVESQLAALGTVFRERHGITHVTLQPETRALHDVLACCDYPDSVADADHSHPEEEPVASR